MSPTPVLDALKRLAHAMPAYAGGAAAEVAAKASSPFARRWHLRGEQGPGRVLWEPFPTPGERLADTPPLWCETPSTLIATRNAPAAGIPTGILFERAAGETWPGLVSARFVVMAVGPLPYLIPMRVLIDVGGYDGDQLCFGDFMRQREGLPTARDATQSELLMMFDHIRPVDDRYVLRCLPGPGAINIRQNGDRYDAIAEHGPEGLRAGLASTVVELDARALAGGDDRAAQGRRRAVDYAIQNAPFIALSALRLAGIQQTLH